MPSDGRASSGDGPDPVPIGGMLGPYRVIDKIGQGGMGVVYRGEDSRLGREVALKVLPLAVTGNDERRRRFLREARAAALVDHANIATVYDVGEADGRVYLAMELVEGQTLRARITQGPLEPPEAAHVARELALGLARAHQKGIVHRDLKPENVMLTRDGGVKILDFGLAKVKDPVSSGGEMSRDDTQTQEGRVMGTPGYMSPEQALGKAVDQRTDVYALGVVLHEMLTGDLPGPYSDSKTPAEAGLATIVARCVARQPERRWGDAGEVVLALDATRRRPPTPSRPPRPKPRTSRIVWMGLAMLAAGGIVAALALKPAPASTAAPAPSASTAAPTATTLATLPAPATTVAEARSEYAAGLQFLRDDALESARQRFEHAAALDPAMAMAHLRAAMTALSTGDPEQTRAHFTRASAFRGSLGERDRTLLEALEPIVGRTHPDEQETIRRLQAASERFPLDEEFVMQLASLVVGDAKLGLPTARRATDLDPADAAAWETYGRALALSGDVDGGRRAFETCASVSLESSDCFFWMGLLDAQSGRCAEMEADALRESDVDPRYGNLNLAVAQYALGRPEAVVRETLTRYLKTFSPERGRVQRAVLDVDLDALSGHFDDADRALQEESRALDATANGKLFFDRAFDLTMGLVELHAEEGDTARVRAAAKEFADRSSMFTRRASQSYFGDSWWQIARATGAPLDPARTEWANAKLASSAPGGAVWIEAWAAAVETPADAAEALAAVDRDPRLTLPKGGEDIWVDADADAAAGHTLLLAGRAGDAVPLLRRAVADCYALLWPFQHVRAQLDLGQALEQTGDRAGACESYGRVLARWKSARPRSVSADAARRAMQRLRCEP